MTTMKPLLGLLLLLSATAGAQPAEANDHYHVHEQEATYRGARLAVADAMTNTVRIVDVDSGAVIGTFTVPGDSAGSLIASGSGRYAVLAHRGADRITILHSGLSVENHGDHGHLLQESPYVLTTMNVGREPTHLKASGSDLLIFNDADGTIAILDESVFGLTLNYGLIETGEVDQGTPLKIGEYILAGYTSSGRVDVFGPEGGRVISFQGCPGLHGAMASDYTGVFGCRDGVLIVELQDDRFHWQHVGYPAGTPEGDRVGTFYGTYNNLFIGDFGAGIAIVNPEAGVISVTRLPETPGTTLSATVTDGHVIVLSESGRLSVLHLAAGGAVLENSVNGFIEVSEEAGRPDITSIGSHVYVTDPATGTIRLLVSTEDGVLHEEASFRVPGNPGAVVPLMPEGEFSWH